MHSAVQLIPFHQHNITDELNCDLFSVLTEETSSGLLSFMRKTKSVRHKPELEGIYLDDLKLDEMDPEVVKLYFPKK